MRKLFTTTLVALFAISSFSQTTGEIELMQKAFAIEKLQIVAAYVNPGDEFREIVIETSKNLVVNFIIFSVYVK